jgi:hypothetical protein
MTPLHTLRNTPWLARLALLWFALTLGVAVASPLVNPQQQQMVCSAAGMIKLVVNDDGTVTPASTAVMHCPLCAVSAAPPAMPGLQEPVIAPAQRLLQRFPTLRLSGFIAPVPPSRGPPVFI